MKNAPPHAAAESLTGWQQDSRPDAAKMVADAGVDENGAHGINCTGKGTEHQVLQHRFGTPVTLARS